MKYTKGTKSEQTFEQGFEQGFEQTFEKTCLLDSMIIDVSGYTYTVPIKTLQQIPFFKQTIKNGVTDLKITIDKNPKGFSQLLEKLKNPDYEVPIQYEEDFRFYGVTRKQSFLKTFLETTIDIIDDVVDLVFSRS